MKSKIDLEKIPNYKIVATGKMGEGIKRISFVKKPAIMVNAMAFSEDLEPFKFAENDEQMILAGPVMIPNIRIPRKNEDGMYYTVEFTKEVIAELVEKFNSGSNNTALNDDHQDTMVDSFIRGNWIVEHSTYDKSKFYGYDLTPGTFFMEVKFKDRKYWEEEVKGKGKTGFSIEAMLNQELERMEILIEEYMSNCIEENEVCTEQSSDITKLCTCGDVDYSELINSMSDEEFMSLFTEIYLEQLSEDELEIINNFEICKKFGKK